MSTAATHPTTPSTPVAGPVVVVGGGLSGIACARALHDAGREVVVVDRGHRIGGRMASKRLEGRPVDTGASYLTVSDRRFAEVVEAWRVAGLAHRWTDTFSVLEPGADPSAKEGPVRWGTPGGMRSLVEDLAEGLDVRRGAVERVESGDDGLRVVADGVDLPTAGAVVLAMPDEQAARLLGGDHGAVAARLTRPSEPVIALVARWPERAWDSAAPGGAFHGAFVNGDDDVAWIADDGRRRGDDAPVLVAHSTPALAARHLDDPAAAGPVLVAALRRLLDLPEPASTLVHRWSLAKPTGERAEPCLLAEVPGGLVGVCGDGWGPQSKVEGAWLSGTALAEALLRLPGQSSR